MMLLAHKTKIIKINNVGNMTKEEKLLVLKKSTNIWETADGILEVRSEFIKTVVKEETGCMKRKDKDLRVMKTSKGLVQ